VRNRLKRSEIIKGKNVFRFIYKNGIRINGELLRCHLVSRTYFSPGVSNILFGVVVQKYIRRSVDRNRIRRLIREAYRINKTILQRKLIHCSSQVALLFVFRKLDSVHSQLPTYIEIEEDVKNLLEKISNLDVYI